MDPKTGAIHIGVSEEGVRAKGLIPLTTEELEKLQAMSTDERKVWAQRKLAAHAAAQARTGTNRKARRAKEAEQRQLHRRSTRMAKRLGLPKP